MRLPRAVAVIVMCLVALGSIQFQAAASKPTAKAKRIVSLDYEVGKGEKGIDTPGIVVGSVSFPGGPENHLSLEIADNSGRPVLAEIVQDDDIAVICGKTTEPIRIEPGFDVQVRFHAGVCPGGDVSLPTGGTMKATFAKQAPAATETRLYSTFGTLTVGYDPDPPVLVRMADVHFVAPGRRYVEFSVTDSSGTPVAAKIEQSETRSPVFCGETDAPLQVDPHQPFTLLLFSGPCGGAGSVVTDGSVSATFLKRP